MPAFYTTPQARRLAYHKTAGASPNLVFLGGFKSDMQGSKALFLESWAQQRGFSYLRFDYSGHGESSGVFTDGSIGNWAQDAEAIISEKTQGPIVLVGSSMGGWIALLLAQRLAGRVAGLMTIAAAPDFTEDAPDATARCQCRSANHQAPGQPQSRYQLPRQTTPYSAPDQPIPHDQR